jgi:hypothetical protein
MRQFQARLASASLWGEQTSGSVQVVLTTIITPLLQNRIVKARYGIVTRGVATNLSLNTVITGNVVGSAEFGSDQIGKIGIYAQHDTNATITGNIVQNIGCLASQGCAAADRLGIAIGGDDAWSVTSVGNLTGDNYTVTDNIVRNVIEEKSGSAVGIRLGTGTNNGPATNNLIANNFISGVRANGVSAKQAAGIAISGRAFRQGRF